MYWNKQKIKSMSRALPLKYRVRVLTVLNTQNETAALREFNLAWKFVNGKDGGEWFEPQGRTANSRVRGYRVGSNPTFPKGSSGSISKTADGKATTGDGVPLKGTRPSPPSISCGNENASLGNAHKVVELTSKGYSVGMIAKELSLSRRSVLAIRARFHKKTAYVPLCTTPTTTHIQRSQPQVHKFEIEIGLPWEKGNNGRWRESIKKELVRNYRENKEFRGGVIEDFELDDQVSVRSTPYKLLVNITGVWGSSIEDCKEKAWLLAQSAALRLSEIYGYEYGQEIPLRFKGAEWALVNHETAKKAIQANLQFITIVNGSKRMWTDKTPGRSLEFSREEDAKTSYRDEEARVFGGLTNENLAARINDVIGLLSNVVKLQEFNIKKEIPQNMEEIKNTVRSYYIG